MCVCLINLDSEIEFQERLEEAESRMRITGNNTVIIAKTIKDVIS